MTNSTGQTIASGTTAKIKYQTVEWDIGGNFDNATNYRYTPTVAGYYLFTAVAYVQSTTTARYGIVLRKNGSDYRYGQLQQYGGTDLIANLSAMAIANGTTDYFEIFFVNPAAATTVTLNAAGGSLQFFQGLWLHY